MLSRAAIDRLIGVSPCVDGRLPDVAHRTQVIPTPAQIHALAAALPERYRAVPLLAAATGLRGGELFGLELPGSVDFLRREVHVHQRLTVTSGRSPYLAPPKTKTSTRTVELPEVAGVALAQHLERFPAIPVVLDDDTDPRRPARRPARLVLTNERGPAGVPGKLVARVDPGGRRRRAATRVRAARPTTLLRHQPDPRRQLGEDGAGCPWAFQPDRHPEHLCGAVAGGGRPDPRDHGRRARAAPDVRRRRGGPMTPQVRRATAATLTGSS
jgi:integrase